MPEYTQDGRFLWLHTPLEPHLLLVTRAMIREEISAPFELSVEMIADITEAGAVQPDALVGKPVTLQVAVGDDYAEGPFRYFDGVIRRFIQTHTTERYVHYRIEVAPWFWFLKLKSNCRIFQAKSAPDIVQEIFDEAKAIFPESVKYRLALSGSYTAMDYCVQYRESDFNFVSRLLEQEGIFYFFEYDMGEHVLVLGDSPSASQPCPEVSDIHYVPDAGWGEDVGHVITWEPGWELHTGKTTVRDHNFHLPTNDLESEQPTTSEIAKQALEAYEYSTADSHKFNETDSRTGKPKPEGAKLVKARIEQHEATHRVATGKSFCRQFSVGYKLNLMGHPSQDGEYLLTSTEHTLFQEPFYLGEDADLEYNEEAHENSFTAIPADVPYRPPRAARKPVIAGPQTAVVTGPGGEEIWTDKYGRVQVKFFWDRGHSETYGTSCWLRVSSPWAGSGWGGINIPRIGQEVIVTFLEGDPDRPIVTGRVYNPDQMPPYELPTHQTRSTLKTRSSKKGSASNFNEVRFEDLKGKEQLFLHAEKDMDVRVKKEYREHTGGSRHSNVGGSYTENIAKDRHITVGKEEAIKIGADQFTDVAMNKNDKVGMVAAVDAGMEVHLKAGLKVIIEGGLQVTLKGPGGFIDIGPAGVTIQGTLVRINSGGAAGSGSGVKTKTPKKPDKADDGTKGTKL
jgi:type VI secretion system secreted protein VgrG